MTTLINFNSIPLSKPTIDLFLLTLVSSRRKPDTIASYERKLTNLLDYLPDDKILTQERALAWCEQRREEGYSNASISAGISAVNSFVRYVQGTNRVEEQPGEEKTGSRKMLTRDEYFRLINEAKRGSSDRDVLLIRVFGEIGIKMQDLPSLTAKACIFGQVQTQEGKTYDIPPSLQKELINYSRRVYVEDGPLFISHFGNPIDRAGVNHIIHAVADRAGLDPALCCPRALRRMCFANWEEVHKRVMPIMLEEYDKLLSGTDAAAED